MRCDGECEIKVGGVYGGMENGEEEFGLKQWAGLGKLGQDRGVVVTESAAEG